MSPGGRESQQRTHKACFKKIENSSIRCDYYQRTTIEGQKPLDSWNIQGKSGEVSLELAGQDFSYGKALCSSTLRIDCLDFQFGQFSIKWCSVNLF
jgi:hypothetical protein